MKKRLNAASIEWGCSLLVSALIGLLFIYLEIAPETQDLRTLTQRNQQFSLQLKRIKQTDGPKPWKGADFYHWLDQHQAKWSVHIVTVNTSQSQTEVVLEGARASVVNLLQPFSNSELSSLGWDDAAEKGRGALHLNLQTIRLGSNTRAIGELSRAQQHFCIYQQADGVLILKREAPC